MAEAINPVLNEDRRSHLRMEAAGVVAQIKPKALFNFESYSEVSIIDISRGGASLRSEKVCFADVGDTVKLRLYVGGLTPVEVDAEVRYSMSTKGRCRYGVRFINLPSMVADYLYVAERRLKAVDAE